MKRWTWIAGLLAAAGCASQPKEPPRIQMQGFSISRPAEKEPTWVVVKSSPTLSIIGKQGRYAGESFAMQAAVVKLDRFKSIQDMISHVEAAQRKEIDPKRHRLFKLEVHEQKIHGQSCTLSRIETADRAATDSSDPSGSPVNVMQETMTLVCPHPKDATKGINMSYTHRHYPEDVDPQFADDAALLMGLLEFDPL